MAMVLGTNYGFVSSRPTSDPSSSDVRGIGGLCRAAGYFTSPTGSGYTLTDIGVWIDYRDYTETVTLGLYAGDADPSGSLLASGTVSITSTGWKYVTLSSSYTLTSATKYWLAMASTTNNPSNNAIDVTPTTFPTYTCKYINPATTLPNPWNGNQFDRDYFYCCLYGLYSAPVVRKPRKASVCISS